MKALIRATAAAAMVMAALLLSGCTITSETNLVTPGEAVAVLPPSFEMVSYNETGGTFSPTADGRMGYTLSGTGYVDTENTLTAYFVPQGEDRYLLAFAAADGALYGLGRLKDGILEISAVFAGDPEAEAAALGEPLPEGVVFADGGVMVADRAGLDAVVALVADGTFTTSTLIAWVGGGTPPATITRDGDWYRPGS